jgi:transposase-like protein
MKKSDPNPILEALRDVGSDETKAVALFEEIRWGKAPTCAWCASPNVYRMTDRVTGERERYFRLRCRACGERFTVRTGTVMEESRIPLHKWAFAYWAACAGKKGTAAMEIHRKCEVSYKSALFMMQRIRHGLADVSPAPLGGPGKDLEADETYCGGRPRNRGMKYGNKRGRGTSKTPVFALVERGGEVRTRVLERVSGNTVGRAIREMADFRSRLLSDESPVYMNPGSDFAGGHETTNHRAREYARGDVHSNTVESFFSRVKRGLNGVHHSVSKFHLHRYMTHWAFLHNTREMDDGERTASAILRGIGKRLTYLSPCA